MMSLFAQFLKKQWFSILLLTAVALGVVWTVKALRPRGSMSVIEAQSMDMTTMKAPVGTFPVETDFAIERMIGGSATFPATVQALNDEDVVARVAGLVKKIEVYPGDSVKPGQLLGMVEAHELGSQGVAAGLDAEAARMKSSAMQSMIAQEQASVARAKAELKTTESKVRGAEAKHRAAQSRLQEARDEVPRRKAEIDEQIAELTLAEENVKRYRSLYEEGAVPKIKFEEMVRTRDTVRSRLSGARAAEQQAKSAVETASIEVQAAQSSLEAERNGLSAMRAAIAEAEARLKTAFRQAAAESANASAVSAKADSAKTVASYVELRALSAGVVTERVVSPGTPVMSGQVILRIKSTSKLRVQADLPQSYAGKVTPGSPARIKTNGHILEGAVSSVFPYVDDMSRTFRVEVMIDSPGKGWDVGSYSEIEVFTDKPSRRLSVRNEAVKTASDGTRFVWVVHEGKAQTDNNAEYTCTMHPQVSQKGPGLCPICKMELVPRDARGNMSVQRRKVVIGLHDGSFTEIVSGLDPGEQVTTRGDDELFPGAAVKPVERAKSALEEQPNKIGSSDHEDHASVGTEPTKPLNTGGQAATGDAASQKYTCPMHPEVIADTPGICPICKMDLTPLKKGEPE
ncbi:MAG: efflux RND transporter periplasmic adaptor subunit [Fimbriimonadaceae bacterium]|nr:efflux RND transporter periplasmic adaptor subunit [Fimbriimonadaceae bacterium]